MIKKLLSLAALLLYFNVLNASIGRKLHFLQNNGQWDAEILYKGTSAPNEVFIMKNGLGFCLSGEEDHEKDYSKLVWVMDFAGTLPQMKIIPQAGRESAYSYLRSSDPTKWIIHPMEYESIMYQNIYKNTDLVLYTDNLHLKYDYILKPGSNVSDIKNIYRGVKGLQVNQKGELEIQTAWEKQVQRLPVSWQMVNGKKKNVDVQYILINDSTFGFEVKGSYDNNYDLIIDPLFDMVWSSYTATTGVSNNLQYCYGSAMDRDGNVYLTGKMDAYLPVTPGSYSGPGNVSPEIFVSKFSKDGTTLIYSTYLPGNSSEFGADIAVDDSGRAYVTGTTDLNITGIQTYPTTPNAYQMAHDDASDAFLTVLSADGSSLVYSSFLGGNNGEGSYSLALGNYGEAYLVGMTSGFGTFPVVNSSITSPGGLEAFVAKFDINQSGSNSLIYSVRIGGGSNSQTVGRNIAVNSEGNAFITGTYQHSFGTSTFPITPGAFSTIYNPGNDNMACFAIKLSSALPVTIEYCTFIGPGQGHGIDVLDATDEAYIAGNTVSDSFPITPGVIQELHNLTPAPSTYNDGFITKLNATGTALVYSTFLGGTEREGISSIAVNSIGEAYVAGIGSENFPTSPGAYQPSFAGGLSDFFIAHINSTGTAYACGGATYVGGENVDYTGSFEDYPAPRISLLDHGGNFDTILVAATTHSQSFPTTPGVYGPVKVNGIADQPVFFKLSCFVVTSAPTAGIAAVQTPACGNVSVDFVDSSANVPQSWQWYFPGATTATSTQQHPQDIIYDSSGTYIVSLVACNSIGCDSTSFQLTVNVPSSGAVVSAGPDLILCNNDSVTITATPGFATYAWELNGSSLASSGNIYNALTPGIYIVNVTDSVGCTATDTVSVQAANASVSVSGNTAICAGDSTVLSAGSFTDYQWTLNGLPFSASPAVTVFQQGNYAVTVTDNNGCTAADSILISVNPLPDVQTLNDTTLCDNATLQLMATGASDYLWSPSTYLNNDTIADPVSTPLSNITYSVTGTDVNGCTAVDSITVSVGSIPDASFAFTVEVTCEGLRMAMQNNSVNASSYLWIFGDGSTSAEFEPVHVYQQLDDVTVQLIALDNGCSDTAIISNISLSEPVTDSVPNIITPNGDNINDCFLISNSEVYEGCFSLHIYNRWGSEVKSISSPSECWDGKSSGGEALPDGTYYYILTVGKLEFRGSVMIAR